MSFGVASCTSVPRTNTLIISAAPATVSATIESQNECDTPNTTMHTPNSATLTSILAPLCRRSGKYASTTAVTTAPTPPAARNQPSPIGPTCRISCAYTGSSATAPPSNTANISSEIDPSTTFSRQT